LLPLIYTHPAAAGTFLLACLIWGLPEMIGMSRRAASVARKSATVEDRGSLVVLLVLQWVGLGLNFALAGIWPAASMVSGGPPGAATPWQQTALFALGVIFILLGVALRWYSIRTLGRYFTRDVAVSSDQPVVQHGPYRLVRHPAYSGTLLTMLGVGLAVTNWASLISLLVCVLLGYAYRVTVEEQALVRTIGQPYVEYMRHTKRFIPLVF
jgi:protein-S-isoprenylcysteine O-methyltransferase Ste14